MTRKEEILKEAQRNDNPLSFVDGAVWADKTMLAKVCEWLDGVVYDYIGIKYGNVDTFIDFHQDKFIDDLCKAMED